MVKSFSAEKKTNAVHLTMDVWTDKHLDDAKYIKNTISELVEKIGMQPLSEIMTFEGAADPGVTGIVVIETSHIAFHGFSDEGMLYMDVFSCIPFDSNIVLNFIKQKFDAKKIKYNIVEREFTFISKKLRSPAKMLHAASR
jgi:S-adenosylmethionine decarboxylase